MPKEIPDTFQVSQLEALRISLAAMEGERARLIAKYDQRIADLKKAIEAQERDLARQPAPASEKAITRPKRSRKSPG